MINALLAFAKEQPEAVIEILVGIIGFVGVILSLKADRKVKIVEFIADYNLTFLTTPEFTILERKLEGCNDAYWKNRKGDKWIKDGQKYFENACNKVFNTSDFLFENENIHRKFDDTGSITAEYQSMVNYLVYLESFATLITQKRVKIKDVDDLFGYRFFIAVNNPVLQQNELIPYMKYYQGIVKAYRKWTRYYKNHRKGLFKKAPILEPIKDYSFSKKLK